MFFVKKTYQSELIDIHNHMLYGVDDGAQDIETSLKMLEMAYDDGVHEVILTPHHHPRRGCAPAEAICRHFDKLRDACDKHIPGMKLHLGREIYYASEKFEDVDAQNDEFAAMRMCNTDAVLIEFSTSVSDRAVKKAVENVMLSGFVPIVAHVERYIGVLEHPEVLEDIKDMGGYIQINSASFLGLTGNEAKKLTKMLLNAEMVDFVATDAHDTKTRVPLLNECFQQIARKYGESYAKKIFYYNPKKIIHGEL